MDKEIKVFIPHLLRMARQNAREAVKIGGVNGGGFEWALAQIYLDGAVGNLPIATYEKMAEAFDLYGQG